MNTENSMNKKQEVIHRRHDVLGKPILGGVLLMFYAFILYEMAGLPADENETLASLYGILCCALLLVVHRLWFWPELKSCLSFSFLRDKVLIKVTGIFFAAVVLLIIPSVIRQGFAAPTTATLIEALGAGFCEEVSFRVLPLSVMMRSYKDNGRYLPALLLPAILFGLVHLINLYDGGDVPYTLMQVAGAMLTGVFFAAVYLRTGSLIPSFLIHFLYDFIGFMQASVAAGTSVLTVPELLEEGILGIVEIILVIMLLKGRKEEIRQTWKKIWSDL